LLNIYEIIKLFITKEEFGDSFLSAKLMANQSTKTFNILLIYHQRNKEKLKNLELDYEF
jgi:hypothetical protein